MQIISVNSSTDSQLFNYELYIYSWTHQNANYIAVKEMSNWWWSPPENRLPPHQRAELYGALLELVAWTHVLGSLIHLSLS